MTELARISYDSARSPGKIIITGEHAVLYGSQALAAAVAKYTTISFIPLRQKKQVETSINGKIARPRPLSSLAKLKNKLDRRFESFLAGNLPVRNILNRPDDLLLYTLATAARHLPLPLPEPGRIVSRSEIPLGAGMGSSAAAVAATLLLTGHLLKLPEMSKEHFFERVRFCERLQHGKGSALDAAAVTYGGLIHLNAENPRPIPVPIKENFYLLLHGIPNSSTGECVSFVRKNFASDTALWRDFSSLCRQICEVFQNPSLPLQAQEIIPLIRENHRFLQHIGVVPKSCAHLIGKIEQAGGAAKISGAGATIGENAGMILIYHPDFQELQRVITEVLGEKAQIENLEIAAAGAEIVYS